MVKKVIVLGAVFAAGHLLRHSSAKHLVFYKPDRYTPVKELIGFRQDVT